jgi:hypothetical protein
MDAQKDILLGLLANNPDQIGPRVTLRTSWNLIRKQHSRSSPEAEIPQKKLGFQDPCPPPLPLGGGGPWSLEPGTYIYIYIYMGTGLSPDPYVSETTTVRHSQPHIEVNVRL